MSRNVRLGIAVAIVVATVAAYLPALRAGFVWNDDTYLSENPTLDAPNALSLIWTEPKASEQYYPLVFTTFWLEKQLWGLRPFGYHLVNVLLHAASALLLWWLLHRLGLPAGWLAAALFALHPVCVESVAWVTERKNTLSLLLSLLAAHAYLASREALVPAAPVRKGRKGQAVVVPWHRRPGTLYAAALVSFTLALLAKTTASLLPAVLLLLAWWRHGRLRREDLQPLIPFFLVGAALAYHTAHLERTMVRAEGSEWSLGLLGRVVLAGRVFWFYVGKLVWPLDVMFVYPRWVVNPAVWWQWLPAASALGLVAALWLGRKRLGRGPLAGALLLGGLVFPAMGFFNVYAMRYSYVADHFAYQAVAAGCALLVCGVASWLPAARPRLARTLAAVGLAVLPALAAGSFAHARSFADADTLWKSTIADNPDCYMCHTNYGHSLYEQGRVAEAVEHFEAALRVKPDNVLALLNLARAADEGGDLPKAAERLEQALAIEPGNAVVLLNLGTTYLRMDKVGEAVQYLEEALRHPSDDDYLAHNSLGAALMRQNRVQEAIAHFRAAVALRPDFWKARANLEAAQARLSGRR